MEQLRSRSAAASLEVLDQIGNLIDAAREIVNREEDENLKTVRRMLFEATVELRSARIRQRAKLGIFPSDEHGPQGVGRDRSLENEREKS